MAISEIEYFLSESINPIEFSYQGDIETTNKLILYAPNYAQRKYAFYLEKVIAKASVEGMRLFADFAKPDNDDKDKNKKEAVKPDGAAMIKAIMFSSYDFSDVLDEFNKLLISGACKLDGKETLKQVVLEKILLAEQKNIFAAYIENFIMPSLFE